MACPWRRADPIRGSPASQSGFAPLARDEAPGFRRPRFDAGLPTTDYQRPTTANPLWVGVILVFLASAVRVYTVCVVGESRPVTIVIRPAPWNTPSATSSTLSVVFLSQ